MSSYRFQAKATPFGGIRGRAYNRFTASDRKRESIMLAKRMAGGGSAPIALVSKRMRNPVRAYATMATRGWKNNNSELKYVDVAASNYAADTTGTVTCLNLTAVGDDNTTRDGRQICNRSIHIQGHLAPTDTTTTDCFSRMLIVWDAQPNSGTIAAITDILTSSTSLAFTNLNNRERFTILRDCRYAQGAQNNTATQAYSNGSNNYVINEFINLKDIKTTYSGTTAVIGSVATGALLMVTIGNVAANNGGTFFVNTRLRFTDR